MPIRLLFLIALLLCLNVPPVAAQSEEDHEEDNEFARRASSEFMTVPHEAEKGPRRILAAGGSLDTLLQVDNVLTPGPGYQPFSSLFAEGELRGWVSLTDLFTVNGLFRLEQSRNQNGSGAFVDQNLFTQRLFAVVNVEPLHFYGGKIHPRFGTAWYSAPGIYGDDFADDYELQERLGFGVRADVRAFETHHRLTIEAFQADTSPLGQSPFGPQPGDPGFTRQVRRTFAEGGVSNTGTFESFAVALSQRHIAGIRGLGSNFAIAKQQSPSPDLRDEWSWVAGLQGRVPLRGRWTLWPMGEFASIKGQAGADRNTDYTTIGATLRTGTPWIWGVHGSTRDVKDYGANLFHTALLAGVSVACDIGEMFKEVKWMDGFSIVGGYRHDRRLGVDRDTVGFQFRFSREL